MISGWHSSEFPQDFHRTYFYFYSIRFGFCFRFHVRGFGDRGNSWGSPGGCCCADFLLSEPLNENLEKHLDVLKHYFLRVYIL